MSAPLMMNALTVAGVSAGYGRSPVIAEVGFGPLRPGTVTALIGPNAAGKSTVLKTLTGILRARSGSARLGERELLAHRHADRAAFVRFVPQVFATNARLTVFDLVLVARMNRAGGARAARPADLAAVEQALTRVGIAHLADRMAGALSGGQQQLVALAQALAVPAPVLLLDEPTSALDLRNQLEALRILSSVAEEDGAIVIAALHDLTLAARHADHLVLMGAGRVLMEGSPRDVLCDACCGATYGVTLTTQMSQAGRLIIEASL